MDNFTNVSIVTFLQVKIKWHHAKVILGFLEGEGEGVRGGEFPIQFQATYDDRFDHGLRVLCSSLSILIKERTWRI